MHSLRFLPIMLISLGIGEAAAQSQAHRPDVRAGREVALRTCDACHIVAQNQPWLPVVPSYGRAFAEIANGPSVTSASLQGFLTTYHPHSNMPYQQLSTTQASDVAAYILSLRNSR